MDDVSVPKGSTIVRTTELLRLLRTALKVVTAACTCFVLALSAGASSSVLADEASTSLLSAFESHCIKCHGEDGKTEGQISLLALKSSDELLAVPELLEKLIAVLKDRQMPPEDEPPLPAGRRAEMVASLAKMLDHVRETQSFKTTPIRRMNRFQYNNAVVDLLELDRDLFQMNERLLRRREDYFRPATGKMPEQVRVSSRPLSKDIDNQRPEGFRGVAAFPQDKRAEHGFDNRADHLTLSPLLMESFLQLSQTIVESPDFNPTECRSWNRLIAPPGQPAGGPVAGRIEAEDGSRVKVLGTPTGGTESQNLRHYGADWSGDTQLIWKCPAQDLDMTIRFDVATAGSGLRFGFTRATDYGTFEIYLDDRRIGQTVDLYASRVVPTDHHVPDLAIDVGPHTLRFKCIGRNQQSPRYFFGLDYIDVTGRKVPEKSDAVASAEIHVIRGRLKKLLRRALRRPVDPETLDRFTKFADDQLASGSSFEDTMRTMVGAVLGMPGFLYFHESDAAADFGDDRQVRRRLQDFELASRLAQFFWSSIPDDTLLDLAESATLNNPDVLSTQIDRMLNDQRTSRFCDNFPAQWLQLERLITSIPDPKKFPYFYYNGYRTSMHMMSEPLLLFETVYIENRSVVELLDPDFTWQSDMLRANYEGHADGGRDVQVQIFKRVPLNDQRHGGVITNAAVMTMTSTPTRTQPITRGAWVNAVIFNDPPEPPPADVPVLPEGNAEELAKLTIRERLTAHRERADCAGCHKKIDPFGFALENFGPTGVWRDKYENGRDVDPSGLLFNEHEFKSVVEFKRLILQHKQRFIRGFVAHLLSYALGRELGLADSPVLDDITAKAMAGEDKMRDVLRNVAMSESFRHRNRRDFAEPDSE